MPLIVESIITTMDVQGQVNVAPMGVYWGASTVLLKPYQDTTTYQNLRQQPTAVIHLTDDASLIAHAAVSTVSPPLLRLSSGRGYRLVHCCSYYVVEVEDCNDGGARAEVRCRVVEQGHVRDFLGFNRARNMLVEAAILATRVRFLGAAHILAEFERFAVVVDKTGLAAEQEALRFLRAYVEAAADDPPH